MDDLIQGLVAVLERGIVVEPYGDNWTSRTGAVRIRLADDDDRVVQPDKDPGPIGW